MKAYLPLWMVEDGAIPELRVGDRADLALQVWCWEHRPAGGNTEGARLLDGADAQGHQGPCTG